MGIALSLSGVIVMLAFYLFLYVNKKDENELLDQRRVIEEFPTVISSLGVFFTFCGIAYAIYYAVMITRDLKGRVFKIDTKICSKKCLFSVLLCY